MPEQEMKPPVSTEEERTEQRIEAAGWLHKEIARLMLSIMAAMLRQSGPIYIALMLMGSAVLVTFLPSEDLGLAAWLTPVFSGAMALVGAAILLLNYLDVKRRQPDTTAAVQHELALIRDTLRLRESGATTAEWNQALVRSLKRARAQMDEAEHPPWTLDSDPTDLDERTRARSLLRILDRRLAEDRARLTERLTESSAGEKEPLQAEQISDEERQARNSAKFLDGNWQLLRRRLSDEVRALSQRANLNLVIGVLATGVAVAILGWLALGTEIATGDWRASLPMLSLRLSLVVFIEVFAFFFLRVYKSTLNEVKYFQNELTNVESRLLALRAALLTADKAVISRVVEQLAGTERNFVLRKGESTTQLELIRLERDRFHSAMGGFSNAVTALAGKRSSQAAD